MTDPARSRRREAATGRVPHGRGEPAPISRALRHAHRRKAAIRHALRRHGARARRWTAAVRLGHRRRVAYRRLTGLWTELTGAVPGAVLLPPPHRFVTLLPTRSIHLLLYRRTVEIRDAQLELTGRVPHTLADAVQTALHDRGRDDDLAFNACALLIGLRLPPATESVPDERLSPSWSTAGDIDHEAAELATLSRLLRDPVILAVVGEVLD
ncbi:DUF6545 domain-containing protein [Actinosynnema sp. NPDC059335]|uniref:DUF6545 domain-containing protein n=1 Tax=Actinosynnema sp. NPDC059335 TaxID=3346804 RepID=UPI00366BB3B7